MKKNEKIKNGVGGISFIVAGVVVMLVPAIFYVIFGDFTYLLNGCSMPFSTVDIGDGMLASCTELRFVYVLSYFCILFGLILVILGIAKKIMDRKST